jgi:hypothetical protein
MAKKNISDYLEARSDEETKLVQAKVKISLYDEFRPLLKGQRQTFRAFIEASMRKFIDEKKKCR